MKCFLRANSPEIRLELAKAIIPLCRCTKFEDAEWLSYNGEVVHGVMPGDDEEEFGTEAIFGNKNNFKEIFLAEHKDYVDCEKNINLFIKLINC